MTGRTQSLLAALTGLIATFGYAGALGFLTGVLQLGDVATARLPFHSAVFAGVALAVIVAVPMTVVTHLAARRDAGTARAAVVAGGLLVGWIVVEIAVVRTYTWLQPVLAIAGLAVLVVGLRALPARVRR